MALVAEVADVDEAVDVDEDEDEAAEAAVVEAQTPGPKRRQAVALFAITATKKGTFARISLTWRRQMRTTPSSRYAIATARPGTSGAVRRRSASESNAALA